MSKSAVGSLDSDPDAFGGVVMMGLLSVLWVIIAGAIVLRGNGGVLTLGTGITGVLGARLAWLAVRTNRFKYMWFVCPCFLASTGCMLVDVLG